MSSPWFGRLSALALGLGALFRGMGAVQKVRKAAADNLRQIVPGMSHAFVSYCALLALLGMLTAGFVLLPVGLVLLLQGLLRDSADRNVVSGLVLGLVGLFYLVAPLLTLQVVSRLAFGRLRHHVEGLATRIE